MKLDRHGLTVSELLILLAILAVLVAAAIPTYGFLRNRSQLISDTTAVREAYADAVADAIERTPNGSDGRIAVIFTDPSEYCTAYVDGSTVFVAHDRASMVRCFSIDENVVLTITQP